MNARFLVCRGCCHTLAWTLTLLALSSAWAAKPAADEANRKSARKPKYGHYNPEHATVDLFAGMKDGRLEVTFIPKNEEKARLFVTNKTGKPLNVKMPKLFAARPALAQMGIGQGNGAQGIQGGGGGGAGQGQGQALGGGAGGGQNGGNNNGLFNNQNQGGGNLFNVASEKTAAINFGVLCLEHGKPNPRPAMKYEIVPIEELTTDATVQALIERFARDELEHKVVQAAVWHKANGLSWDTLAEKMLHRATGLRQPYYRPGELAAAQQAVDVVEKAVAAASAAKESPATSDSAAASELQPPVRSSFGATVRTRD